MGGGRAAHRTAVSVARATSLHAVSYAGSRKKFVSGNWTVEVHLTNSRVVLAETWFAVSSSQSEVPEAETATWQPARKFYSEYSESAVSMGGGGVQDVVEPRQQSRVRGHGLPVISHPVGREACALHPVVRATLGPSVPECTVPGRQQRGKKGSQVRDA